MKTEEVREAEKPTLAGQLLDVFVHAAGRKPQRVRAAASATVAEVLRQAGLSLDGLHVFAGDPTDALEEPAEVESGEDADEPLSPGATLASLGFGRSGHVHCSTCRRIAVTVNYEHLAKQRRFSPAASVTTVTRWARKKFKLSDEDAEKLVLEVCGGDVRPDGNARLGELEAVASCGVCFDLVPDPKYQG